MSARQQAGDQRNGGGDHGAAYSTDNVGTRNLINGVRHHRDDTGSERGGGTDESHRDDEREVSSNDVGISGGPGEHFDRDRLLDIVRGLRVVIISISLVLHYSVCFLMYSYKCSN